MIHTRQLTKRYNSFTAVNRLDLEVARGAICAFLGPNGAGKSTTVRLLSGVLAPTSGEATVCGLDAAASPLEVKRIAGVLPENLGVVESLTVEEHLWMTGPLYGLPRGETRRRADGLLRALALEECRGLFLDQCSHGMRKKTALAMALLPNPRVLFLDEPFEAIDPVTSRTIHDLLIRLAARGVTIFLTSHILAIVERLATQIVLIRAGRVVWDSPPDGIPKDLEQHYFDLVEAPPVEELDWLAPPRS